MLIVSLADSCSPSPLIFLWSLSFLSIVSRRRSVCKGDMANVAHLGRLICEWKWSNWENVKKRGEKEWSHRTGLVAWRDWTFKLGFRYWLWAEGRTRGREEKKVGDSIMLLGEVRIFLLLTFFKWCKLDSLLRKSIMDVCVGKKEKGILWMAQHCRNVDQILLGGKDGEKT